MSAVSLEASLRARGVHCRVEGADRLAVLVPDGPLSGIEDAATRREIVALLREHGFTHVALELVNEPGADAAVHSG